MSALLFPGQGSQIVGMGSEFYNNFDIVKKIFKEADEKLNYSISKLILNGPDGQLQLTQNTQNTIYVGSTADLQQFIQESMGTREITPINKSERKVIDANSDNDGEEE